MASTFDGVLADFNTRFLKTSRKLLGKPEKGYVVSNFHYDKCGAWTDKEVKRVISWMQNQEDFWRSLEPLPNTSQLGKRQRELEYFFITARFPAAGLPTVYQTEGWLREYFRLEAPYVIVSNEKGKIAKDLDLTHFIDDRDDNCVAVKDALPTCEVALLDATWNQQLKDPRIKRVTSFNNWLKGIS